MRLLLHPALDTPTEADVATAYAAPLGRGGGRPWVTLCMVASIDGSTVVGGRSGALSSPTDIAVLAHLRTLADVIVVGAGTVRAEGYGAPQRAGQRIAVFTRSGEVDVSSELFTSGAGLIVTTEKANGDFRDVEVLRVGEDEVDVRAALRALEAHCPRLDDVGTDRSLVIQVEGGPALNGTLFDADAVDEVNLTTSAQIAGGDGPRLTARATDLTHRYELRQAAVDDVSFLYTRWVRRTDD
jgi:5-amino-6-(5-phosphoribosylamino)uracil reductase